MSRFDAIRAERAKPEPIGDPPAAAAPLGRAPARIGKSPEDQVVIVPPSHYDKVDF